MRKGRDWWGKWAMLAAAAAALGTLIAYNGRRARRADRAHPPTGRMLTVSGVRLHFIDTGGLAPPW